MKMGIIQENIESAAQGVGKVRREIERLQNENTRLKQSLDFYEENESPTIQPKRGKKTSSQPQVNQLKRRILELELVSTSPR